MNDHARRPARVNTIDSDAAAVLRM